MTEPFSDVGDWLDRLGLGQYREAFARQEIDAEALTDLTDADMVQLGMLLGHRKRLLRALGKTSDATGPLSATPVDVAPGAERRQLTVLFCDMVGSTALAAQLDPEDLRNVMRPFFDRCTEIIEGLGGHIARYMGDGMLAYFGYPHAQEDAPERAVLTGRQLVDAIGRMRTRPGTTLNMRVGIASGLVVVGDLLGEGASREEAVIGEMPSIAARLQALASPGAVLISDATRRLLGRRFTLEDAGLHELKGLTGRTQVWRVIGEREAGSRFDAARNGATNQLVGRGPELETLRECWRRAVGGQGQVVHLSGVAGVGKSRLARALREQIRREPHTLRILQCSPFQSSTALYPLATWLRRAAGIGGGESADRRLERLEALLTPQGLSAELPLFAQLLAIPIAGTDEADIPPAEAKHRLFEALTGWLLRQARAKPMLVLLEDAHWADATTLELLTLCLSRIADEKVMVIITHRPNEEPLPQTGPVPVALRLGGLVPAQAAALVEAIAGTPLLPELVQQICARTDGVPLFVEELTKAVVEADQREPYGLDDMLARAAIPATLQDSLLARLDRLGPAREVAQTAAAIGREFPFALLHHVGSMPRAALDTAIAALEKAGLVQPAGDPTARTYMFRHALVQEAAYDTLLHSRRRELHARIGLMLEEHFAETVASQPALLAHHYAEAALPGRAINWWQLAAERSRRQSANVEATLQYQRALALLAQLPESSERDRREVALRNQLNPAVYAAMGPASGEREKNFAELVRLHARLGDTARMFPVMWGQCVVIFARCELPEAADKTREYLRLASENGDPVVSAAGYLHLGHTELLRGDIAGGLESLDRALSLYQPAHRTNLIGDYALDLRPLALSCRCLALQQAGLAEDAAELGEQAVLEVKRGEHFVTSSQVLFQVALLHMMAGNVAETHRFATDLATLAERHEGIYWRSHADLLLGWTGARMGRIEEGLARMRHGAVQRERMQGRAWVPQYLAQEAELLIDQGLGNEALRRLDEAEAMVNATDHRVSEPEIHRQRARALASRDAPASEIEAWLQSALTLARSRGQLLWASRAAADLEAHLREAGNEGGLSALLEDAAAWVARMQSPGGAQQPGLA